MTARKEIDAIIRVALDGELRTADMFMRLTAARPQGVVQIHPDGVIRLHRLEGENVTDQTPQSAMLPTSTLTTIPEVPPQPQGADIPPLHPAIAQVLQHFSYSHLPAGLRGVSKEFHVLAHTLVKDWDLQGAEIVVCLRKLLEAKDAAVRSAKERFDAQGKVS